MIKSLRIKNLATIEDIEIHFKKGFSILTGETGAGKSIIIGGIILIMGGKGSSDMIRTRKTEASVEAIFLPAHISSNFSIDGTNELTIQRKISEQKTGKAYINGILVPVKKLKEISSSIVDIYGQNDHAFLRQVENQLDYLDCYSNAFSLRRKISNIAHELRKLIKEKRELEDKEKERERRLDFLDFQIKEIEIAQLVPGEEAALRQERNILKNAEKISTLVEDALNISYNKENSISPLLTNLQNVVDNLSDFDKEFKYMSDGINEFNITIKEFSDFLIKFKEKHTGAPEKLETIEERLSQIEKLKRKYGKSINEILTYLEYAKKEYKELCTSHEKMADVDKELKLKYDKYMENSKKLSLLRKENAHRLEKLIEKEIGILGMKKARFKIDIKSYALGPNDVEKVKDTGTEDVEFLISPNPGEELRPLRKIASGGELSRIMLSLKSIGKDTEKLKTFIFDEIDAGIGGKTAEFVAQKLKSLARENQVICITHLPQIASFATYHYKVGKKVDKNRTFTTIKKLNFDERVNEIAHLSAGSHLTETSLQNAREMLTHNLNLNHENGKTA